MFIDEVKNIHLSAGKGGDGCLSFRREKYIPKGGPNGGNGGNGGSIILQGNENINDLTVYRFKPHAKAQNGQPGMGSSMHGKNGKDYILDVPIGTVVLNADTNIFVCEIISNGEKITLLRGGIGGKGNENFKTSTNQAPRHTTPGTPGEQGIFNFVLKTIADVGLVGFPNAGKSTLMSILTDAAPKIGNYPFTTLHVNVGILNHGTQKTIIADIPGIIKDAHKNKGLGIKFLKHIERCKTILYLLDMSGAENRDPCDDFHDIRTELAHYDNNILRRDSIIVANKMDIECAKDNLKKFKNLHKNLPILEISCQTKAGIEQLVKTIFNLRVNQVKIIQHSAPDIQR